MPCRGLGHWKWSHVLTRAWPCSDITEIRTFERCNACLRTDPGPYPDSAPGPLRPCRGSPWTTPAPSPPSPGASSSCWSRSGLPRKKRGLSSSELRQIASSHSFLSNPPDGGDAAKNPLRPSNAVEQNSRKKNAHVSVYSGTQTHQVSKVIPTVTSNAASKFGRQTVPSRPRVRSSPAGVIVSMRSCL